MIRIFALLLMGIAANAAVYPVMLYVDVDSGPKTRGVSNNGVFITVTGKRFGNTPGTLKLGGSDVVLTSWADTKIVFQPGSAPALGLNTITASRADGESVPCWGSGYCDFTVRSTGNIYCVSNSGSNANNGKFLSSTGGTGCWKGLEYSVQRLAPGDTLYFGASSSDTFQSEPLDILCQSLSRAVLWVVPGFFSNNLPCGASGTAGNPIAIVGYPGNSATLGGTDGTKYPMEVWESASNVHYWTMSNLNFIGSTYSYNNGNVIATQGKGFRGVNLDLQLPLAPDSYEGLLNPTLTGATTTEGIVNRWYGLYLHNLGIGGSLSDRSGENSKHSAMIYQGADGNEQEFGWLIVDGTPKSGVGGVNRCYHNHSSPGTGPGYPIFGVHIHDSVFTGCSGNTFDMTVDPGKGSGVEVYNNIIYHTGTCQNWVGYTSGYAFFLFEQGVGGGYDYAWQPQSGLMKFYNNTVYDVNSCTETRNGLFYGPGPVTGNVTFPPPPVTICSSSCTATHYSGTLPATTWGDGVTTPYYFALGVVFETTLNNGAPIENLVDDGSGHLTQEGQVVGTINYYTGAYDFTFLRTPPVGSIVQYYSIYSYRTDMKNNIIQLKSGQDVFWDYSAGQQLFNMDHNLFYNEAGVGTGKQPTWPIKVTSPIGTNSSPMFVNASAGNFRLQTGSPAIASGTVTGIARDIDGFPRTANDLGAYAFTGASPSVSPSTLPSGIVGVPYSQSITATNFTTTVTWTVNLGTLPTGLSLNSSTGVISGTPATPAGSPFAFTIRATDGVYTIDTSYSITITGASTATGGTRKGGKIVIGGKSGH